MKAKKLQHFMILQFVWVALILSGFNTVFANEADVIDDLSIEQIALMTKRSAVEKLQALLEDKKRKNEKNGVGVLWLRLAEEKQQIAAIEHRVNQEKSEKLGRAYNDNRYRSEMKATISVLDQAIKSDPLSASVGRAYFLRGKAHREVGNVSESIRDFNKFITQFPNAGEASLVHFALGELYYTNRDYKRAIESLSGIKFTPSFKHQAEALNILAWSHYSIGNHDQALEYSRKEIGFYQDRIKNERSPYLGNLERAAADYVQFYVSSLDRRPQDFNVDKAYADLKSVAVTPSVALSDKIFGSLAIQFVKVLRVKLRHEQIDSFKEKILIREKGKMLAFEVLLQVLDHQIAYQRVQSFERTLAQIDSNYLDLDRPKLVDVLSKKADTFTQYVQKNKGHQYEGLYRRGLNQIYSVLLKVLPKNDPRAAALHYNIAENAQLNGNYLLASKEYRRAFELAKIPEQEDLKNQSELKSVAARLESLKRTGTFPAKLQVRKRSDSALVELTDDAEEWMVWVKEGLDKGYLQSPWDSFAYESARLSYLSDSFPVGIKNLREFVKSFPGSQHSPSAQTLTLDTLIQDQAWDEVKTVTAEFKSLKGAAPLKSNDALTQKFATIESDANFKEIEQQFDSGNLNSVFQNADQALGSGSQWQGVRRWDVLALGLAAALQNQDSDRAYQYSSALSAAPVGHKSREQALKIRAEAQERRMEFIPAIHSWLEIGKIDEDRKKRILEMAWMTGNPDELKKVILDQRVCPQQDELHCDRFRSLLRHLDSKQKNDFETQKYAYAKAVQSKNSTNRWLWASLAWNGVSRFQESERSRLQKILTDDLESVDSKMRLGLMAGVESGFRYRIQQLQKSYQAQSASRGDILSVIDRKVKVLEKFEEQISAFRDFSWMPTQLDSAFVLIEAYHQFSKEMTVVKLPPGISEEQVSEFNSIITAIRSKVDEQSKRLKREVSEWVVSKGIDLERSDRYAELMGFKPHDHTLWNLTHPNLQSLQSQPLDSESKLYLSKVQMNNIPMSLEAIQRFSEVKNQDISKVYFLKGYFFYKTGVLDQAFGELAKVKTEDGVGIAAQTERLRLAMQTYDSTHTRVTFEDSRFLLSRPGHTEFTQAQFVLWSYAAQFSGAESIGTRKPSSLIKRSSGAKKKGGVR